MCCNLAASNGLSMRDQSEWYSHAEHCSWLEVSFFSTRVCLAPAADQYLTLGCEPLFVCIKQHYISVYLTSFDWPRSSAAVGSDGGHWPRVFLIYQENVAYGAQ